jgi:hypothetical protein
MKEIHPGGHLVVGRQALPAKGRDRIVISDVGDILSREAVLFYNSGRDLHITCSQNPENGTIHVQPREGGRLSYRSTTIAFGRTKKVVPKAPLDVFIKFHDDTAAIRLTVLGEGGPVASSPTSPLAGKGRLVNGYEHWELAVNSLACAKVAGENVTDEAAKAYYLPFIDKSGSNTRNFVSAKKKAAEILGVFYRDHEALLEAGHQHGVIAETIMDQLRAKRGGG